MKLKNKLTSSLGVALVASICGCGPSQPTASVTAKTNVTADPNVSAIEQPALPEEKMEAPDEGSPKSDETPTSNLPADCFFSRPGDVTVVTDGNDFRLRMAGGFIGSEVFASKQAAIDYIYAIKKIKNPTAGKNYQPAL